MSFSTRIGLALLLCLAAPARAAGSASPRPAPTAELGSVLLKHALTEIGAKRFRDAVADLRDFAARFPDHVYDDYAHYWLAFAHYQLGEFALAQVTSDFLLYRHPYSFKAADGAMLNAMCRVRRGDRARAIDELKAALEANPESVLAPQAEALLFSGPR